MKSRELLILAAATVCGFWGGSISNRMNAVYAAHLEAVRASRFDLMDDSGRLVSSWGVEAGGGSALKFLDKTGRELLSVGMSSDNTSPFVNMKGKDGKIRLILRLDDAELPSLAMGDQSWEGRVMLGSIEHDVPSTRDDDWGLIFRAPGRFPDLVSLGVHANTTTTFSGRLTIGNSSGTKWSVPQNAGRVK